jgi:hypothetical protein
MVVQRDGEGVETVRDGVVDQVAGRVGQAINRVVRRVRMQVDLQHLSPDMSNQNAVRAGTLSALARSVTTAFRIARVAALAVAVMASSGVSATVTDPADGSIQRFLVQNDDLHPYRAVRRLEAENGDRKGWIEAQTEYSPSLGFSYQVTAEGGSSYIRGKILRAVLDGERDLIAQGNTGRSALTQSNYIFRPHGIDADGLANVLLSPRRKAGVLVNGTLFLQAAEAYPVRLQGRLAKNPSFWVKNVDIVRTYARMGGAIMPVALQSTAEIRLFGPAALRMTYTYSEIDGHPMRAPQHE